MDPAAQTLQYFKPPSPLSKTQRDFIPIRSLSYQRNISETKLQEDCAF